MATDELVIVTTCPMCFNKKPSRDRCVFCKRSGKVPLCIKCNGSGLESDKAGYMGFSNCSRCNGAGVFRAGRNA